MTNTKAQTAEKWQIFVAGYGQFDFEGTEAEAEEMRAHKSRWERGVGTKWRDDGSPLAKLEQERASLWASGKGVPQSLMKRIRAATEARHG